VQALAADVEPAEGPHGEQPLAAASVPAEAWCELRQTSFSIHKLPLAIQGSDTPGLAEAVSQAETLLRTGDEPVAQLVDLVGNVQDARWLVRAVTTEDSQREFGLRIDTHQLFLLENASPQEPGLAGVHSPSARPGSPARVLARYDVDDTHRLRQQLSRDLLKIARWQTVWQLADDAALPGGPPGLQLQVFDVEDKQHWRLGATLEAAGGLPAERAFHPGQILGFVFSNRSSRDMWLTLLYLDANYGVQLWAADSIPAGGAWQPIFVEVDDDSLGAEGIVALATAVSQSDRLGYEFLEQSPVGLNHGSRAPAARTPPATGLQQLLTSLPASREMRDRALDTHAPQAPEILSWTWISRPAPQQAQARR
jgi:hypothetical protein